MTTPDTPRAGAETFALPGGWRVNFLSEQIAELCNPAGEFVAWFAVPVARAFAAAMNTAALTPDRPAADAGAAAVAWQPIATAPEWVDGHQAVVGQLNSEGCWCWTEMWAPQWDRDHYVHKRATHWTLLNAPPGTALARSPAPAGRPSREALIEMLTEAELYGWCPSYIADRVLALFDAPPDAEAKP